jgi:hypothetical protein
MKPYTGDEIREAIEAVLYTLGVERDNSLSSEFESEVFEELENMSESDELEYYSAEDCKEAISRVSARVAKDFRAAREVALSMLASRRAELSVQAQERLRIILKEDSDRMMRAVESPSLADLVTHYLEAW